MGKRVRSFFVGWGGGGGVVLIFCVLCGEDVRSDAV